ncbi:hypothetical protein TevJSym_ab01270 [endosymbiont of Tevnia jerichonana (vent Tica)]|uniref:Uncharacterized protein n=1 Tax=endosymbiont of Tevnia jerichonana (vent Tica) TaxID=1049564 RepID=G2FBU3_9GAMM|nr:hypothetical protein TevJSym_ab01270 [endosymbiont of Tevnia jerichonana (vent Tica)]
MCSAASPIRPIHQSDLDVVPHRSPGQIHETTEFIQGE